eukprot:NODE_34_length_36538_cov_0.612854.p5 type:complete len:567 gc:universal NODE_34_length_36538_cov_0.612854:35495-33795(-)
MSLLYQILIPFQKSIPCIYPSSTFDYAFKLLDESIIKMHFEPYPMSIESRFFTTSISYAGLTGSGHAFVKKENSCDQFPSISAEFTFNHTNYKLLQKNGRLVIDSGDVEILENAASDNLVCATNSSLHDISENLLGPKQLELATDATPCPKETKYINLGIMVDCSVVQQSNEDIEAVMREILGVLARTNSVYKSSFNLQLILTVLDIRSSCSQKYNGWKGEADKDGEFDRWNIPCAGNYSMMQRISDFSKWRGGRKDDIDLWHLYSTCPSDGKVGLAWPSAVCHKTADVATGNNYFSGVSIATRQKESWKVMAHEIAHNLGAIHDCLGTCDNCNKCDSCDCRGQYIMNPNQNVATDNFASGSISTVCNNIPNFSCIRNSSSALIAFSENVCGNGILEAGEECDCGDLCSTDTCCTKDCKLTKGSTCSDKNESCCSGCQVVSKSQICRKKESVCDFEEVCDGIHAKCPNNVFVADGTSCHDPTINFDGHCASKYCTSSDKQCTDAYPDSSGSCTGIVTGDSDCKLTCKQAGGCAQFDSFLIDGSICGGGFGKCKMGSCEYSSSCNQN